MPDLPPGWDIDYDGNRWFYRYKPTGLIQYTFPKEGDEYPEYIDAASPAPTLAPEERLESQQQIKRKVTAQGPAGGSHGSSRGPVMSATGGPLSTAWDGGFGDDDEDAGGVFQPESFMYLGPGAYTDISPLVEEEDETAILMGAKPEEKNPEVNREFVASPPESSMPTPSVIQSTPVIATCESTDPSPPRQPEAPSTHAVFIVGADIFPPPDNAPAASASEEPKKEEPTSPGVPMLDSRDLPHELPETTVFNPVGIIAEMPTEATAMAHIELHPDPVEMADNAVLAPIETFMMEQGLAELPAHRSPTTERNPAEATEPPRPRRVETGPRVYPFQPREDDDPDRPPTPLGPSPPAQVSSSQPPVIQGADQQGGFTAFKPSPASAQSQSPTPPVPSPASQGITPGSAPPQGPTADAAVTAIPPQQFKITRKPTNAGTKPSSFKPWTPGSTPPVSRVGTPMEVPSVTRVNSSPISHEAMSIVPTAQSSEPRTSNAPAALTPPAAPPKVPMDAQSVPVPTQRQTQPQPSVQPSVLQPPNPPRQSIDTPPPVPAKDTRPGPPITQPPGMPGLPSVLQPGKAEPIPIRTSRRPAPPAGHRPLSYHQAQQHAMMRQMQQSHQGQPAHPMHAGQMQPPNGLGRGLSPPADPRPGLHRAETMPAQVQQASASGRYQAFTPPNGTPASEVPPTLGETLEQQAHVPALAPTTQAAAPIGHAQKLQQRPHSNSLPTALPPAMQARGQSQAAGQLPPWKRAPPSLQPGQQLPPGMAPHIVGQQGRGVPQHMFVNQPVMVVNDPSSAGPGQAPPVPATLAPGQPTVQADSPLQAQPPIPSTVITPPAPWQQTQQPSAILAPGSGTTPMPPSGRMYPEHPLATPSPFEMYRASPPGVSGSPAPARQVPMPAALSIGSSPPPLSGPAHQQLAPSAASASRNVNPGATQPPVASQQGPSRVSDSYFPPQPQPQQKPQQQREVASNARPRGPLQQRALVQDNEERRRSLPPEQMMQLLRKQHQGQSFHTNPQGPVPPVIQPPQLPHGQNVPQRSQSVSVRHTQPATQFPLAEPAPPQVAAPVQPTAPQQPVSPPRPAKVPLEEKSAATAAPAPAPSTVPQAQKPATQPAQPAQGATSQATAIPAALIEPPSGPSAAVGHGLHSIREQPEQEVVVGKPRATSLSSQTSAGNRSSMPPAQHGPAQAQAKPLVNMPQVQYQAPPQAMQQGAPQGAPQGLPRPGSQVAAMPQQEAPHGPAPSSPQGPPRMQGQSPGQFQQFPPGQHRGVPFLQPGAPGMAGQAPIQLPGAQHSGMPGPATGSPIPGLAREKSKWYNKFLKSTKTLQKAAPPQPQMQATPPQATGWMQQGGMGPQGFVYQPARHTQQYAVPPGMPQNIPSGFQQMAPPQFAYPQGFVPQQMMQMPPGTPQAGMPGGPQGQYPAQPGMLVNHPKPSTPVSTTSPTGSIQAGSPQSTQMSPPSPESVRQRANSIANSIGSATTQMMQTQKPIPESAESDGGSISTMDVSEAQAQPVLKPQIVQVSPPLSTQSQKAPDLQVPPHSPPEDTKPRQAQIPAQILAAAVPIIPAPSEPMMSGAHVNQTPINRHDSLRPAPLSVTRNRTPSQGSPPVSGQISPSVRESMISDISSADSVDSRRVSVLSTTSGPSSAAGPARVAAQRNAEFKAKMARKPVADYSGGDWGDDY
ncbi:hypothetical protein jhhlp_006630 [Lomentospora prolificans]|uniref:WW domain-containing protein n=1 Tax=Lomentospora prolificans TaxID=41688 RepID=A0A2N3N6G3_9PEZI|nr:hypothetical protein jhhlp_006630 [Lomentospora prolificans]